MNYFSDCLEILKENYADDVAVDSLLAELAILKQICMGTKILHFSDLHQLLIKVPEDRQLIPNVILVCMLLLVNPATSATAERSFSLARRIETWLRSTMSQKSNSLAVCCHKECTDNINSVSVGNEFISKSDERKRTFGKFEPSDSYC